MLINVQHFISSYFRKIYANQHRIFAILIFQKITKRRNMLRFQSLLMVIGSLLLMLMPMHEVSAGELKEVAPGIYVRHGLHEDFSKSNHGHIANIGFIVGNDRVAVIDTGSNLLEGKALRQMIREVTDLPIEYVILTHMHPDHSLGTAAFRQDNPKYIGHAQLGDALARRQSVYLNNMTQILGPSAEGTEMVFPDTTVAVDRQLNLDLGGRLLHLTAYPTAHTNNDITIYDRKTGTLWLSDLLFVERIPVIDGSILGWLKVINGLIEADCFNYLANPGDDLKESDSHNCSTVERVVPGHGSVVTQWKTALANQRRYLENIANDIREIIKKGGTITQAVEQVGLEERHKWLLFKKYHGRNVTAAFAELEWE